MTGRVGGGGQVGRHGEGSDRVKEASYSLGVTQYMAKSITNLVPLLSSVSGHDLQAKNDKVSQSLKNPILRESTWRY